ncbi:hypothetical protein BJV77DRAFT_964295 [Russula vinacea]|nr:hypothetical protein BJV77DRAFT_964295 [Russula vinacea]
MEHSLSGRSSVGVGAGASVLMPIASLGSPHHGEGEMRGRRRIRAARAAERRREGREILTEFESASNIRTIQHAHTYPAVPIPLDGIVANVHTLLDVTSDQT